MIDGVDQTDPVMRSANSRELVSDLYGRFLEGRWGTRIEGLKAEEVHDALGVGHDVDFDGLVIRE